MRCPYFEKGTRQDYCNAHLEGLMVPSISEEEMFCKTILYQLCPWYSESERKGVDGQIVIKESRNNFLENRACSLDC